VALSDSEVASEVGRLCVEIRQARLAAGRTTREVAAAAGMNQGSLYRIEQGQIQPAYLTYARLAEVLGKRLELDDGAARARVVPRHVLMLPGGEVHCPTTEYPSWRQDVRLFYRLHGLGQELRWARHNDLETYPTDDVLCDLLGISHHTLRSVEAGPKVPLTDSRQVDGGDRKDRLGWPRLASMVSIAAVTGRRLVLVDEALLLRLPPWDWRTGSLDELPPACRLPDMDAT
jgi:transcriptional regulator with XRE-family HTH domain